LTLVSRAHRLAGGGGTVLGLAADDGFGETLVDVEVGSDVFGEADGDDENITVDFFYFI
jgi:hypothetical protein